MCAKANLDVFIMLYSIYALSVMYSVTAWITLDYI